MKSEAEILSIIEHEEKNALGYLSGELSQERADALDYYEREARGDEVDGQSQVVSSEVADTIEWLLPSLIKIFTSSDKAVEFEPETPKDEQSAKQATQAVNYVFYRQNNGFLVLYSWFKDALLQKNGYVKYWWEKSDRTKKETYRGLTDEQLTMLSQEEGVEIVAHTAEPAMDQMGQPMVLHDVQLKITQPHGKVCVEPVPPEEILVNRDHRSLELQTARFVAHRCKKSASDLLEMGYPQDKIDEVASGDDSLAHTTETSARDTDDEQTYFEDNSGDKSTRNIWVTEAYILIDKDDNGIAERRKIVKAGKVIFEDEECERVCISAITPKIRPHRHIGSSVAEDAMEIQDVNTGLLRGTLNNLYLTNAPRNAVLSSSSGAPQANLDDLLSVRVGGLVREFVPNAVRPLVVPYVGNYSMQMMEYMDQKRMNRTGVNNLSSGLDADAINKTARGAVIADNAQQQRTELIARVMAETGVKDLFQGILYLLCTYSTQPMMIRLRDEFVPMDPREWNHLMDMTINVGLGTGNKDQQLVHLQTIMQIQAQMVEMGGLNRTVTEKNIYNASAKLTENAGFKQIEDFFTDPEKAPPQQPQPNPEQMKVEADIKAKQTELQMKQVDGQNSIQIEREKLQLEREKLQMEMERTRAEIQMKLMTAQAEMALEREKSLQELEIKRNSEVGKLQLQAQNDQAKLQQEGEHAGQKMHMEREDRQVAGGAAIQAMIDSMNKGFSDLSKTMGRPRKIVRGSDGRAAGVE